MEEKKQQKRTIKNREKILKAAEELFKEKGYFQTNTKEIARVAGLSTGSFYNYFPDKLAIFKETVLKYGNQNIKNLEQTLEQLNADPNNGKKILTDYVQIGMKRAIESVVLFKDYDNLSRSHELTKEDSQQINQKAADLLFDYVENNPQIIKRNTSFIMSQVIYFLVQGFASSIAQLPEGSDFEAFEKELVEILYWYILGK